MKLSLTSIRQLNSAYGIISLISACILTFSFVMFRNFHDMQNASIPIDDENFRNSFKLVQNIQHITLIALMIYSLISAILALAVAFTKHPSLNLMRINYFVQFLAVPIGTALGIATMLSLADNNDRT